jgi:type VI secretion system ImpM family protein
MRLFRRKTGRSKPTRHWGCTGKLPCHGDFLRRNASLREVEDLDRWFSEGILEVRREHGPAWERLFDAAPPSRIFYRSPEGNRVLAAYFHAESDRVGRRYPFLLFVLDETVREGTRLAPFVPAMEPLFRGARELVEAGRTPMSRGEFLRRLECFEERADPLLRVRGEGDPGPQPERMEKARSLRLESAFRRFPASGRIVLRLPPVRACGALASWTNAAERCAPRGAPLRLVLWNQKGPGNVPRPLFVFGRILACDFDFLMRPNHPFARCVEIDDPIADESSGIHGALSSHSLGRVFAGLDAGA